MEGVGSLLREDADLTRLSTFITRERNRLRNSVGQRRLLAQFEEPNDA